MRRTARSPPLPTRPLGAIVSGHMISRRAFLAVALIVATVVGTASAGHHGAHVLVAPRQPAPRVGPSYLYPDPAITPGVPNPHVTQANIQQTICVRHRTATIRPAPSD